jgi:hypothetical protein
MREAKYALVGYNIVVNGCADGSSIVVDEAYSETSHAESYFLSAKLNSAPRSGKSRFSRVFSGE